MWPCDDARPIEHCVVNVHAAVAQLMGLDGSEDRDGGLQLVDAGDPERWASLPLGSFPCPSKSAKWTWVKLSYKSRDAGYFQASAIQCFDDSIIQRLWVCLKLENKIFQAISVSMFRNHPSGCDAPRLSDT